MWFGNKKIEKFFFSVKDIMYFLFTEYCIPETPEEFMEIYSDPCTKSIIKHSVYS